MNQRRITRRSMLTATLGAALTGCGIPATPTTSPAPVAVPPPPAAPPDDLNLIALEGRSGGRLGVHVLDTGTGATVSHRGRERFLMASTAKLPLTAAVLDRATNEPALLDRLVRYGPEALLEYAPVTTQNVATGMTVADLCDAALTVSDNTAANLLLDLLGGPAAVTTFVRGLGDPTTRFDRTEPELNVSTSPDDERDTTTPAAIVGIIRAVTLSDGLAPAGRDRLTAWLVASTTGDATIRAGIPAGWAVGDKTGTGAQGERNDVGIILPPDRAPLVLAVFTDPDDPDSTAGNATIAEATAIAVRLLVSQ
ncbi:MAB family class A beta-lactamase [Pseudonocardia petroleophila]|uniref:Beta-lactamase n=2 Tax=Pseudonocardia petroleophila TaxID=37331 RepID=A0A7G7MIV0_9PSEU|nr:class A beta-lactamase [Pseudonocardia petroleophila]